MLCCNKFKKTSFYKNNKSNMLYIVSLDNNIRLTELGVFKFLANL